MHAALAMLDKVLSHKVRQKCETHCSPQTGCQSQSAHPWPPSLSEPHPLPCGPEVQVCVHSAQNKRVSQALGLPHWAHEQTEAGNLCKQNLISDLPSEQSRNPACLRAQIPNQEKLKRALIISYPR